MLKEILHIVTSDEGPPLTKQQQKSLQDSLGEGIQIEVITAVDAIKNPIEHGVVWPYFRGIPETKNDILSVIDREWNVDVVNDYQNNPDVSNKRENHEVAESKGIPTPKTQPIDGIQDIQKLPFSYPLVIKGYPSGRGEDVHLCKDQEEAIVKYEKIKQKGLSAIGQEYIEESRGTDLRVLVVDGELSICLKRRGAPGEFLSNVSQGGGY